MSSDEQAIRELIAKWMVASEAGDVDTVLGLMTDDVVFLVPGHPPFGKDVFADAARKMKDARMEGRNDIKEVEVLGDLAWVRNHITVTMTPPGGAPARRSGYTLSVFKKQPDGRWLLARDANLLTND
jgi:uncharacterized protein (TIGR02246 family)